MTTKTIFQQIIDGDLPSYKIWEDDKHLAFLDIMPIHPGQILVIPKKPIDYVFDMDDEDYIALMKVSKKVARIMMKALKPIKVGMIIEGLEVPHVHVKLVPIDYQKSLGTQTQKVGAEDLAKTQQQLLRFMIDF